MSLCQAASCVIRVQAQNMIAIAARNPQTLGSLQLNLSKLNLKESIPKYTLMYVLNYNDNHCLLTVLPNLARFSVNVNWRLIISSGIQR